MVTTLYQKLEMMKLFVFIITIQVDGGIELKYHKINDHRWVIKIDDNLKIIKRTIVRKKRTKYNWTEKNANFKKEIERVVDWLCSLKNEKALF